MVFQRIWLLMQTFFTVWRRRRVAIWGIHYSQNKDIYASLIILLNKDQTKAKQTPDRSINEAVLLLLKPPNPLYVLFNCIKIRVCLTPLPFFPAHWVLVTQGAWWVRAATPCHHRKRQQPPPHPHPKIPSHQGPRVSTLVKERLQSTWLDGGNLVEPSTL